MGSVVAATGIPVLTGWPVAKGLDHKRYNKNNTKSRNDIGNILFIHKAGSLVLDCSNIKMDDV